MSKPRTLTLAGKIFWAIIAGAILSTYSNQSYQIKSIWFWILGFMAALALCQLVGFILTLLFGVEQKEDGQPPPGESA